MIIPDKLFTVCRLHLLWGGTARLDYKTLLYSTSRLRCSRYIIAMLIAFRFVFSYCVESFATTYTPCGTKYPPSICSIGAAKLWSEQGHRPLQILQRKILKLFNNTVRIQWTTSVILTDYRLALCWFTICKPNFFGTVSKEQGVKTTITKITGKKYTTTWNYFLPLQPLSC